MWVGCAILCLHRRKFTKPKVQATTTHVNLSASSLRCWCQAMIMDKAAPVLQSSPQITASRWYRRRLLLWVDNDRERVKAKEPCNLLTCGLGATSLTMIRTIQIAASATQ